MRKLFLIAAILLSATAVSAGADLNVSSADVQSAVQSSEQPSDASDLDAKRQAMIEQKMAMQKQRQLAIREKCIVTRYARVFVLRFSRLKENFVEPEGFRGLEVDHQFELFRGPGRAARSPSRP